MEGTTQISCSNTVDNTISLALDEISLGQNEEQDTTVGESCGNEGLIVIEGVSCFGDIDFDSINAENVKNYHFVDIEVAYEFYNEYGRVKGFSVRKSKVVRNSQHEIVSQTFLCSHEGMRHHKFLEMTERRREPKAITRCGCNAQMRIHVEFVTGHWYVTLFNNSHNHELVPEKFRGSLRSHRKMKEGDIDQMNSMRRVGISTPKIFGSLASQSRGFQMIGFHIKDMYNQIDKQRRIQDGDAKGALKYLQKLRNTDSMMFWRHSVDDSGKLKHLFWCDGTSQRDYDVFGDVLGFDATYGRNKYKCPVVVFSGVNHHMNTIVFGCAILSDETEQTYVWLLRQFTEVMKGKFPVAVITDGDLAMRNAIKTVFPKAHHRLCGWHLLRNATTNVGKANFTREFKKCMMGDFEVDEFNEMWESIIDKYGLQDNNWVAEMYEKRAMWATAHMRGKFFAGLRTTSRCEALHSQIGKYIQSGYNLTEFIEHFQQFLEFMRYKELDADYKSWYGQPMLRTKIKELERHASMVYTREVFNVFRDVIEMSALAKIAGHNQTATTTIFFVGQYRRANNISHVSFQPSNMEFRCSCMMMESVGVPCVHIVGVLVQLDITELPKCLILHRWTKMAKDVNTTQAGGVISESSNMSMYTALLDDCRDMCKLACRSFEDYISIKEKVYMERAELRAKEVNRGEEANVATSQQNIEVRDPERVRHKGCGSKSSVGKGKGKRIQRCTKCRQEGHNSRKCLFSRQLVDSNYGSHEPYASNEQTNELLEEQCSYFGDTSFYE